MNSDEFNDLEKFGKIIEKPTEKEPIKVKKKEKNNSDINLKKVSIKILNKIFCFITRLLQISN